MLTPLIKGKTNMADDGSCFQHMIRFKMALTVLRKYTWLLDSYILDFFIDQHFQKLPKSWLNHFRKMSVEELARFLDYENYKFEGLWPLSLLCLHFLIKHICLPRKLKCRIPVQQQYNFYIHENLVNPQYLSTKVNNKSLDHENSRFYKMCSLFTNPKLKMLLAKHVKLKKRYEIMKMAEVIAEVANKLNIKYIVDVGSGLGHLSRIACYGLGLKVLSIESQAKLINEARKLDEEFEVTARKFLSEKETANFLQRPVHLNKTITDDMTPIEFLKLVKDHFGESKNTLSFGIVGLHSCGNLAVKLMNFFAECEEAKFINLVGCCYHKETLLSEYSVKTGFPLSNSGQKSLLDLSFEARSLACHALESYTKRLMTNDYHNLKIHCYRAALEYIISRRMPNLRKSSLKNLKYEPKLTFDEYCQKALNKAQYSVIEEDVKSKETSHLLSQWKNVVIFYSLRLKFAPLIESVILMDRMLYLIENDYYCNVKALFEPEVSPRNFVLVATKEKKHDKLTSLLRSETR